MYKRQTLDGALSTASYLGAKVLITTNSDTSSNSFVVSGTDLDGKAISETISGSNSSTVKTTNIFQTVNSVSVTGSISTIVQIGTEGADGEWAATIDANNLEINTNQEISSALAKELRIGTPISQLKGSVISSLPPEGSSLELSFEGQIFKASMKDGEIIIDGPEENRVKARFHGTSNNDSDAISLLQSGTAGTSLVINGLSSVAADSDGLVELMNPSGAGVISRDGALKDSTSLNSRITIKNRDNDDNTPFKYTITGTDQDGNVTVSYTHLTLPTKA